MNRQGDDAAHDRCAAALLGPSLSGPVFEHPEPALVGAFPFGAAEVRGRERACVGRERAVAEDAAGASVAARLVGTSSSLASLVSQATILGRVRCWTGGHRGDEGVERDGTNQAQVVDRLRQFGLGEAEDTDDGHIEVLADSPCDERQRVGFLCGWGSGSRQSVSEPAVSTPLWASSPAKTPFGPITR